MAETHSKECTEDSKLEGLDLIVTIPKTFAALSEDKQLIALAHVREMARQNAEKEGGNG
jgi:hypothetical protein